MFELLLFLGFSTLIVRFNGIMNQTSANLTATTHYIKEAQAALKK